MSLHVLGMYCFDAMFPEDESKAAPKAILVPEDRTFNETKSSAGEGESESKTSDVVAEAWALPSLKENIPKV